MRIYIAHSRDFDYQNDLYALLRARMDLPQEDIILPHESKDHTNNTREFYRTLDLMIAEVSFPATGLGIELGWAADDKTPVFCIHRADRKLSGSVYAVTDKIYEYTTKEEMIQHIADVIKQASDKQ